MKPGYKQTEVGVIPEDWEVKTLGEIGGVRMCKRVLKHQTREHGDVPFYKIGTFGGVPDAFISHPLFDEFKRKYSFPQKGDVLISAAGTIGRTVIYDGSPAYFQDSNIVWIENDESKATNVYLWHCYQITKWSVSHGGTVARLYNDSLKTKIFIPVPTLPEQRAIATALSDVDALLAALERLIAKKRNLKQAAMQQLLTGKKRLPGFEGEWEVKTVSELEKQNLVKLSRGNVISKKDIAYTPGDHPIYSSSIHNNGMFGRYGRFMFDEELITWSVDGGGNFFHRHKHRFSVTNVCGFMRVDTSQISYRFLAAQLQLLHSRKSFDYQSKAHPSVVRKEYQVQLPTLPEQIAIAEVLSDMEAELAALEQRLEKTRGLKQGMMQELLTGRTRLV